MHRRRFETEGEVQLIVVVGFAEIAAFELDSYGRTCCCRLHVAEMIFCQFLCASGGDVTDERNDNILRVCQQLSMLVADLLLRVVCNHILCARRRCCYRLTFKGVFYEFLTGSTCSALVFTINHHADTLFGLPDFVGIEHRVA